jgi:hypothetical protein
LLSGFAAMPKSTFAKQAEHFTFNVKRAYYRMQGRQVVHFLHIGKTGGTAVRDTLQDHTLTPKYKIFLHGHHFTLAKVPEGDKCFFVLRDPISRFVSGFYGRQRMDRPRYNLPWLPTEEIAFKHFQTPNQLALALSSPDSEARAAAEAAMEGIAHVRSSYWQWFRNEDYFLSRLEDILFVGFQEQLSADFATLRALLHLPETVVLPEGGAKAHRNPDHLDKHLDEEGIANLRAWYARDYEFLSLCKTKFHYPTVLPL